MAAGHRDGTADLGALRSVHKERVAFVLAVLLAILGSAIVGGAHFWGLAPWVLGLISAVVLTGVVALGTIARGYVRIDLHEHGVTLRGRAGTRPVRFDDVLSVTSGTTRRGASGAGAQRHVVEVRGGAPFEFSQRYGRAPELLAALQEGTRERLRGEVLRAYDAGDVVHFGPFAISEAGLRDGGAPVLAWTQLDRATLDAPVFRMGETRSQVKVWRKGATAPVASYPSESVPNAFVMVDVVSLAVAAEDDPE